MRFSDHAGPTPPGVRASPPPRMRADGRGAIPCLRMGTVLVAAAGLLGGCTSPDAFAPACPQIGFVRDGADLSRFDGTGHDITDLVLEGHLVAVPAACRWAGGAGHGKVEATLKVKMSLSRGPAMPGRTTEVPYFVAVSENDAILDRQDYVVRAEFPPNTDLVGATSPDVTLLLPVSKEKSAVVYKIWASFRLTPEELAFNRGRGTP